MPEVDEQALKRAEIAARERQDFTDQQNELMGNETGRRARFLGGANARTARLEKERKDRVFRDLLDRLLDDPEYRALYEELGRELSSAEFEADDAISDLEQKLADVRNQIDALENAAARGPDGQPVFKTADGRVVAVDGQELPPEIADGIIWPANAPTAEDYFTLQQNQRDLTDLLDQWRTYRFEVLGDIRDRYDDREKPMTKDDYRNDLARIQDAVPDMSKVELVSVDVKAPEAVPLVNATLPMTLN